MEAWRCGGTTDPLYLALDASSVTAAEVVGGREGPAAAGARAGAARRREPLAPGRHRGRTSRTRTSVRAAVAPRAGRREPRAGHAGAARRRRAARARRAAAGRAARATSCASAWRASLPWPAEEGDRRRPRRRARAAWWAPPCAAPTVAEYEQAASRAGSEGRARPPRAAPGARRPAARAARATSVHAVLGDVAMCLALVREGGDRGPAQPTPRPLARARPRGCARSCCGSRAGAANGNGSPAARRERLGRRATAAASSGRRAARARGPRAPAVASGAEAGWLAGSRLVTRQPDF